MLGLEFPPTENLVEWPPYFADGTFLALNKIGLISLLAMLIPAGAFALARRDAVPRGLQNVVESIVEFVENQVILAAIGPDGLRFLPLLLTIFLFVFVGNVFEVIPTFQMPANARMANPAILAVVAFGTYVGVGFRHHGLRFLTDIAWPRSVPLALRPLVGFIELVTVFVLRPLALAIRLFANMLAGHILLVTFSVLCIAAWQRSLIAATLPLSFGMLVVLTAFEIFVSFLQAFIFVLLTAVFIDASLHPAH